MKRRGSLPCGGARGVRGGGGGGGGGGASARHKTPFLISSGLSFSSSTYVRALGAIYTQFKKKLT